MGRGGRWGYNDFIYNYGGASYPYPYYYTEAPQVCTVNSSGAVVCYPVDPVYGNYI
jgi:hypothetical protein